MTTLSTPFGPATTYSRILILDGRDLRCIYYTWVCMIFLPKQEVLFLEGPERLCAALICLGAMRLRMTGGKPLVRREALTLLRRWASGWATV